MSENRRRILEMLANGRITADEAERLLTALDNGPAIDAPAARSFGASKYLRILVEREPERAGDERTKVNIRVPLQLLRAGVRLKSLLPDEARDQLNEALREKGVDFDVNQFKAENLDELLENMNDLTIDIDKKSRKAKVRVFCE